MLLVEPFMRIRAQNLPTTGALALAPTAAARFHGGAGYAYCDNGTGEQVVSTQVAM